MMKSEIRVRSLAWIVLSAGLALALVIGLGAALSRPATAAEPAQVDVNVYVALDRNGQADVLVLLKEKADLSGARLLEAKADKGAYVYQQLKETAERTQPALRAFLEAKGVEFRSYWIQNMFKVKADAALVAALAVRPEVARLELYTPPTLDVIRPGLGPDYGEPLGPAAPETQQEFDPEAIEWNIDRTDADLVWGMGITGTGAIVGDLDTGVQWDHPALINSYREQIPGAPTRHDYNWFDGIVGAAIPTDYDSHGTHTMGTIVGDDGGANQIGMAPGADWIACPGIGSPYVGPFECFEFFIAPTKLDGTDPRPDLAPHVINNSWSSAGTNFHDAIIALYEAGIFFAKSAGNTGSQCNTITNPGQWREVTATAAYAQGDTIASFSSRGPVTIGREKYVKPDIANPGVAVRSSVPGNGYALNQGTSMAAPHTTGAVALLVSAVPDLAGKIDILQYALKNSAGAVINAQCTPFVDHPNDVWGWGIMNIYDAVQWVFSTGPGAIMGDVYEDPSGDPIAGAEMVFSDVGTGLDFFATSEADGSYFRDLFYPGTFDITVTMYGYIPNTIEGVATQDGAPTIQNVPMVVSPLYTVSGVVTETQTGDPLKANLVFEGTPVSTESDPLTGEYSMDVATGEFWLAVSAPGHTPEAVKLQIGGDRTENFSLDAIQNYYMRSMDTVCEVPAFEWIDAMDGTAVNLGDDAYQTVALPRAFTYYGVTKNNVYFGSNGIATFNPTNAGKWSGPIPDPATPNDGIYAFSTDLNPANGTQGHMYYKYVDSRYFVMEWYQVEHYPSGDPETFEIILDLDTGAIKIQYLEISNVADATAGVENATGTEATQYAYADPVRISDGKAVTFYPAFGTPPEAIEPTAVGGLVADAFNTAPINGALVTAVDPSSTVYTTTTGADGMYNFSGGLCAATYDMSAEATGFFPSEVIPVDVAGETVTQDFELYPFGDGEVAPDSVTANLLEGETGEALLTISNVGAPPLDFHIEEAPAVDWLTVAPENGVVDPATSATITLTLDASALTSGFYTTTLQVYITDPDTPMVEVAVELTVGSGCEAVSGLDFTWMPVMPMIGELVEFSASAEGTAPITFSWDFGDGGTGTGETATHTFTTVGPQVVSVAAGNCGGNDVSQEHTVTVAPIKVLLPLTSKN